MNWQEPSVFLIVILAAFYIGRAFVQQFGKERANAQPACSKCSSCGTSPTPSQQSVQILRRKND